MVQMVEMVEMVKMVEMVEMVKMVKMVEMVAELRYNLISLTLQASKPINQEPCAFHCTPSACRRPRVVVASAEALWLRNFN